MLRSFWDLLLAGTTITRPKIETSSGVLVLGEGGHFISGEAITINRETWQAKVPKPYKAFISGVNRIICETWEPKSRTDETQNRMNRMNREALEPKNPKPQSPKTK